MTYFDDAFSSWSLVMQAQSWFQGCQLRFVILQKIFSFKDYLLEFKVQKTCLIEPKINDDINGILNTSLNPSAKSTFIILIRKAWQLCLKGPFLSTFLSFSANNLLLIFLFVLHKRVIFFS